MLSDSSGSLQSGAHACFYLVPAYLEDEKSMDDGPEDAVGPSTGVEPSARGLPIVLSSGLVRPVRPRKKSKLAQITVMITYDYR